MNLKIGVLTFHRCINYGSYWQARCLAEGLQALGHDTVILDHYSRRVNIAEWKCALQPVLPTAVPASDHTLYREKMLKFFSVFETLPLSPRFELDDPYAMESYDAVVVGSDEVWNLSHPWYGKCPLFYGDGLQTGRLISYAASFGNYNAFRGLETEWAERLRNFSSISVRDKNSQVIVNNAIGTEPEMVLDPCLQFPIPVEQTSFALKDPYVAVYGHNFSASFAARMRSWAEHRKLRLVSIGYRNDWADEQIIAAGPHEFAGFVAGAAAVATNFFHGCIFALNNNKPFVCETSPYRSNKVLGLMEKIGGEKHLVREDSPPEAYVTSLDEPLHITVLEKIESLRRISREYLTRALDLKQLQYA